MSFKTNTSEVADAIVRFSQAVDAYSWYDHNQLPITHSAPVLAFAYAFEWIDRPTRKIMADLLLEAGQLDQAESLIELHRLARGGR